MAARRVGASQFIGFSIGACNFNGAFTVATIARCPAGTDGTTLSGIRLFNGAFSSVLQCQRKSNNKLECILRFADFVESPTITFMESDGWCLIMYRKQAGSQTVGFAKVTLDANLTTAAENTVATYADHNPGGDINNFDIFGNCFDVFCFAVWNTYLVGYGNALASYLSAWLHTPPKAFMVLDQSSTSQKISDLSGNGSNEASASATTVLPEGIPGFSYGHPIAIEEHKLGNPKNYRVQPPIMV